MISQKKYFITIKRFDKFLHLGTKQNFCEVTQGLCRGSESRSNTYAAPCIFICISFYLRQKDLYVNLPKNKLIVTKFNLRKADLIRLGQVWLLLFLLINLFIHLKIGLGLANFFSMANLSPRWKWINKLISKNNN